MAIATGTAIALGVAGAQAASGAYGAKKAGDAAKQQISAGDRALAEQRRVYDDQRAMIDPYVSAGRDSLGTLSRLMAVPPGAQFAAPPPAWMQGPQGPAGPQGPPQGPPMGGPPQGPPPGLSMPPQGGPGPGLPQGAFDVRNPSASVPSLGRIGSLGPMQAPQPQGPQPPPGQVWQGMGNPVLQQPPVPPPQRQSLGDIAREQGAQGSVIQLQAPDGSTQAVPASQASQFLQRGFKKVQ